MDNKDSATVGSFYSFVRKHGPYWEGLVKHNMASMVKNNAPNYYPFTYSKDYPTKGIPIISPYFFSPFFPKSSNNFCFTILLLTAKLVSEVIKIHCGLCVNFFDWKYSTF